MPLEARNTPACFECRRQSGQNTYMMWAKFTLDRFLWLPGQKKLAGGLVRFPPSQLPASCPPPPHLPQPGILVNSTTAQCRSAAMHLLHTACKVDDPPTMTGKRNPFF